MAGLQALLSDEATDMAAKLSEVADITRDMAELQGMASRYTPLTLKLNPGPKPSTPAPYLLTHLLTYSRSGTTL